MGQEYEVVCHDCRVIFRPRFAKIEEIHANQSILADIGNFFFHHRHHNIDLLGDGGDDGGCDWDEVNKYRDLAFFEIPSPEAANDLVKQ